MFYHGTVIGGLNSIRANSKSHTSGKDVAYFTTDRVYALVCCRERSKNFVTMGVREDGKPHYFERFPEQLKVLYDGQDGYLYLKCTENGLHYTTGHTWESDTDVPVDGYEYVENVYNEILKEASQGNVIIHRYHEIDREEQKEMARHIRDHLNDEPEEIREFLKVHFSPLWE